LTTKKKNEGKNEQLDFHGDLHYKYKK